MLAQRTMLSIKMYYEKELKMKKKMFTCSLIVLFILFTATTAFATSFTFDANKGQTTYPTVTLDFSVNIRAKVTNYETYHLVDGTRVYCGFKACLVQGTTVKSNELTVPNDDYKYIYPHEAGSFRLRVKNPYSDYAIKGRGNYQNQYS